MMNSNELQLLPRKYQALLVYFFHDQCAPCLSLRPKISELIEERFPKIKLEFIDALKNPELPAGMGVFAFPTLILYFDGAEAGRWSKYVSVSQLEEFISRPYHLLYG